MEGEEGGWKKFRWYHGVELGVRGGGWEAGVGGWELLGEVRSTCVVRSDVGRIMIWHSRVRHGKSPEFSGVKS